VHGANGSPSASPRTPSPAPTSSLAQVAPQATHPMVTRARVGTLKPNPRYAATATTTTIEGPIRRTREGE
jgi:hypothetical protein